MAAESGRSTIGNEYPEFYYLPDSVAAAFRPRQNRMDTEEATPSHKFTKKEHLLKGKQYDAVFKNGRSVRDDQLRIQNAPNGLDYSRIGLVVGRKVGNAVRRNRVKRLFREVFRLNREGLPKGFDFVFLPVPGYQDDSLQDCEARIVRLLSRLPRTAPKPRGPSAAEPRGRDRPTTVREDEREP